MKVLFLMCDELSWWGLGHTNPRVLTPNIDRFAARARVFSEAYTPSPICVPTRAAIATGKYVHEIGNWSSAEPYEGTVPSRTSIASRGYPRALHRQAALSRPGGGHRV